MTNVSAVILNWKREDNVRRILAHLRKHPRVTECIVWNNNAAKPMIGPGNSWLKLIESSEDLGLYTRFAAAGLCRNECVLIQDDDLIVPHEAMDHLVEQWTIEPQRLHGVFGRCPNEDGSYNWKNAFGDVPIVLTRALVGWRHTIAYALAVAQLFCFVQDNGVPYGNGEDIILSFAAMERSGRLNIVHPVHVEELPSPDPINGRDFKRHVRHRTLLLEQCKAWLEGCYAKSR